MRRGKRGTTLEEPQRPGSDVDRCGGDRGSSRVGRLAERGWEYEIHVNLTTFPPPRTIALDDQSQRGE
jgi:hypothetical protein